MFEIQTER